jgi:hypothetical protein
MPPNNKHITIDDLDKRPPLPARSPHALISGADFDRAQPAPLVAYLPWPAWVVAGVLVLIFGGALILWLARALERWARSSAFAEWLALFLPAAVVGALACVALYWLAGKAYYSIMATRATAYQALLTRWRLGTPVAADQVAQAPLAMLLGQEQAAIALEVARAPFTKYPVLASLNEGSHETSEATIYGAPPEEAAPALSPNAGPILDQLRKRYAKSADHLFVGTVGDTPVHLRWGAAGLTAIAGGSGGGKTNTTRLIAAWHALNGGGLALCDGHGEVDEGLIASCAALSSAFVLPPAVKNADIAAVIHRMDAIGRARLSGEAATVPLLLIIDEFTSLCRNHGDAAKLINSLLNFGDEYRKVNMQALIIGHHWRGDLIDKQLGAALRSAIGARIIHTTAPEEAKFLLRPVEAQGVDRLRVGEALYFDRAGDVQKIVVPWLPAEALREVSYPSHPGWPLPVETPAEQRRTPRQRSLDDIRRQMEQAPRSERLRVAQALAQRGAKQREIQYACCISDEAAGAAWRSAKNGHGVTI